MQQLTIGHNQNNDWVIAQKQISGNHAQIFYDGNGSLIIEDLNSSNGTFINGRRIKKAHIEENSEIALADVKFEYAEIKQKLKIKSNDFSEEFAELENVYNQFKEDIRQIKKKKGLKVLVIRILFSLIPIFVLILFSNSIKNPGIRYALIGISPMIFMVFSFFHENNPKATAELEELQEQFLLKYKCPKCNASLGNSSWKVLAIRKKCPNCKAIWVKDEDEKNKINSNQIK